MGEHDSVLEMFLFESSMMLDQLDEILLQSEKNEKLCSKDIDEIFRIMHTVKGSSSMMEFDLLTRVSHKLEDLLYFIRENDIEESCFQILMDLMLEASDFLKTELKKIEKGKKLAEGNKGLIEKISSLLERAKKDCPPVEVTSFSSNPGIPLQKPAKDATNYNICVHFASDSQMENVRAFLLMNSLGSLGEILCIVPKELTKDQSASTFIAKNGFYFSLSSSSERGEIEKAIRKFSSVEKMKFIDELPKEKPSKKKVSVNNETDTTITDSLEKTKGNLIAVDLNKLDALMDLVGEIVITESMVSNSPDLEGLELENFSKASRQLGKLTDELQDITMSIRMIPVSSTFQKMHRIVRDMNKKLSRNVSLVLMGESTEVDKTIIDSITEPLMHLIRNGMDHGIEDKETRIKMDKEPEGRIILSAQSDAGDIVITVSDDGRGLDTSKIIKKAVQKNILTKPANEYVEKEIFNLITLPGFSTKNSATEFSGRGVGMDVVKNSIERIGGNMIIESKKYEGTTIILRIPLTLSIIPCMEISVGKEIYSIPISNIKESFKASADRIIVDPDQNEMIMIRGICYPVIKLEHIYNIEDGCKDFEDGVFLLVSTQENTACLFVDEILGKYRVVVKPLPHFLNGFNLASLGISGCTILGNGNVSLILDVQGILTCY